MRCSILILAAAAVTLAASPARADSVVTLCKGDRDGGAGTNLATAIAAGGLVTFNCGAAASIQMSAGIPITRNVVIDGGLKVTLVEGSASMFVAQTPGTTLQLKGLKFNGTKLPLVQESAGATLPLTVSGSSFTNCQAPLQGQTAPLTIADSAFVNCTGTVVSAVDSLTIARSRFEGTNGTAVFSVGADTTTQITDSVFTGNSNGAVSVGVGSSTNLNQTVQIDRSTFTDNGADAAGAKTAQGTGAVSVLCNTSAPRCTVSMTGTVFSNNRATKGVGGGALNVRGAAAVTLLGARFEGNSSDGEAGAILFIPLAAPDPVLDIESTVFKSNRAINGAAIKISGARLSGTGVTFSKNVATGVGGGLAADATAILMSQGVFVENVAPEGSAVSITGGKFSIFANTLMVRNKTSSGGAFVGQATQLVNSTIVDNVGAGLHATAAAGTPATAIILHNTIVSGNTVNCQTASGAAAGPGATAGFADGHNNLQFPGTSCGGAIPVARPNLDKLYLPVIGSPALAAGDNSVCLMPPVSARDVYSQIRPQGPVCSIGAAEGDLDKDVADRTVGGGVWPAGIPGSGVKTGPSGTAGKPGPKLPTCCCCGR